ncbi:nucleotide-binding protein YvcJ [Alicyclobacillus cellulosilyticus]|uniref:Nucleotide-binding protein YvcJ n=1 Tax=Alicyclobacillus cellulosilyticus TaxID=1003997 RepID=A0A917NJM0_9BACL|nr:RNase adapter RapZ [Alicyclobacillus cellulosilyticus]GGJ05776.1 nucleotide-binding protein YvcJ [Alicyclobacillus cellulosilyticus]
MTIELIIITGMSGAGKSVAMQSLEDIGYFCVDNLLPALIPKFVDIVRQSGGSLHRIALACDLRGGEWFEKLLDIVHQLRQDAGVALHLVFLDADDETLVRRFKETRRPHPYDSGPRLLEAIQAERAALAKVRAEADVILDTSGWAPARLKQELVQRFSRRERRLPVHVMSFGFKYGIPIDADMVFDVRFLPNPHYVDDLRPYTGEDQPVYDYVMQWPATQEFLRRLEGLLDFLIPEFVKEGKSHLVIGIGCTGGKHRSVAIARRLADHLRQYSDVHVTHRDSRREG